MTHLPIACALDPADLTTRRETLLPGLAAQALSRDLLPDGMRWQFAPTEEVLERITRVIDAERRCCPFLRFELTVEPDGGPLLLAATGPTGTREFLDALTRK